MMNKDCNPGTIFQSRDFGIEKPFGIPGWIKAESLVIKATNVTGKTINIHSTVNLYYYY